MMMVKLKTLPMNNTRIKLAMDDRRIQMMDHSWERLCRRGLHCLRHIFESNECTYTSWQPNIMRIQAEQQLKATRPVTNNVYICIFIGAFAAHHSRNRRQNPSIHHKYASRTLITSYSIWSHMEMLRGPSSHYICGYVRWVQFERAQVFAIRFASAEVSIAIHHIYMQTYIYSIHIFMSHIALVFVLSETNPRVYLTHIPKDAAETAINIQKKLICGHQHYTYLYTFP